MEIADQRPPIRVLGFAGSLRRLSLNRAALRAAGQLTPAGMTLEAVNIDAIPLYNDDLRQEGYPDAVADFRAHIASADALLIVTPEYNYSVPGVLKNAIDWASRPPSPPLVGKPTAIMGVSPGMLGTSRAQYHLRQICVFNDMHVLNKPEVMIGQAAQKFDDDLNLVDDSTRDFVARLLDALYDWTLRLRTDADRA